METYTTTELVKIEALSLDLVSNDLRQIIQVINYVFLAGTVSLFGVGANIINIAVFVKQGFKDSINISLLGLSISDLACTAAMFWASLFYNPFFRNIGLPVEPMDLSYVTGGVPHVCASRITSFITAFITLERCLCIAMPLKVKTIINPFRTKVIIVTIFASVTVLFCPFYFVNKLEWKYSHSQNRTVLSLSFTKHRMVVDSITFFIHSVLLSSVLLLSVVVSTIILVVKLNKKAKWRESSVLQTASKPDTTSVKEKKVVKMIVLIATIFIVCYVPSTVTMIAMVFVPEFNVGGRYDNLVFVVWSGSFVLGAVNSSVNIFVYLKMSTKYRVTFHKIICGFSKKKEN